MFLIDHMHHNHNINEDNSYRKINKTKKFLNLSEVSLFLAINMLYP